MAHSGADDRMDVSEEDHADSSQAAGPSLPADQGVAALGQEQPAGEDEGDDFRADTGSDEEDDEATLEEEEVRTILHLCFTHSCHQHWKAHDLVQAACSVRLHSCLLEPHARLPSALSMMPAIL